MIDIKKFDINLISFWYHKTEILNDKRRIKKYGDYEGKKL